MAMSAVCLLALRLAAALEALRSYSFEADSRLEVAFTALQEPVTLSGRSTTECGTLEFTENVSNVAIAITDKGA